MRLHPRIFFNCCIPIRHSFQGQLLKTLGIEISLLKLTWRGLRLQLELQMLMNLLNRFQNNMQLILDLGAQF